MIFKVRLHNISLKSVKIKFFAKINIMLMISLENKNKILK
jgi:hypothetical protein